MFALNLLGILPKKYFPLKMVKCQKMFQNRPFSLHLVTHRPSVKSEGFLSQVMKSAKSGVVTHVQLRDSIEDIQQSVYSAIRLKKMLEPFKVSLIINNRVDVALATNADGVHLGRTDFPWRLARQLLKKKIIGLTVNTWPQLVAAEKADVDYLGIQLFPSKTTKKESDFAWGMDSVPKIVRFTRHPVVFIGGIGLENLRYLLPHLRPEDGIGMAGELWRGENPYGTAQKIESLFKESKAGL